MKLEYMKPVIETENLLSTQFACCKNQTWSTQNCDPSI